MSSTEEHMKEKCCVCGERWDHHTTDPASTCNRYRPKPAPVTCTVPPAAVHLPATPEHAWEVERAAHDAELENAMGQLGEALAEVERLKGVNSLLSAEVKRFEQEQTQLRGVWDEAVDDVIRLRDNFARENREIEDVLGRALGYPRYCDDPANFPGATDADGVCTGDHEPATLAAEAAERIRFLEADGEKLRDAIRESLRCGWHTLEGSLDGTFDDLTEEEVARIRENAWRVLGGESHRYVYGTSVKIRGLEAEVERLRAEHSQAIHNRNSANARADNMQAKLAKKIRESDEALADVETLRAEVKRLKMARQGDEAPAKCPITGRPFFCVLQDEDDNWVPTYGGPLDSYTIPEPDGDASQPWHERDLVQKRFDHDEGKWRGFEFVPLRIIDDSVLVDLESRAETWESEFKRLRAEAASLRADREVVRAEVVRLQAEAKPSVPMIARLVYERDEALAEVVRLKSDADRMDWLEAHRPWVHRQEGGGWSIRGFARRTLRDTVTAAMAAGAEDEESGEVTS